MFRTRVAVLIVTASILGAVAAWQASVFASKASDLDGLATQQLAQRQQLQGYYQGLVSQDVRVFGRYKQHIRQAQLLNEQADRVRTGDAALASRLDAQAKGERALARTLLGFFSFQPADDGQGNVSYDRNQALALLLEFDPQLPGLRPEEALARAEQRHSTAIRLVGVTVLFIVALFFLTLAQLAKPSSRNTFTVSGVAVIAGAFVLMVLVLVAG